jgi:hypothetical protein
MSNTQEVNTTKQNQQKPSTRRTRNRVRIRACKPEHWAPTRIERPFGGAFPTSVIA